MRNHITQTFDNRATIRGFQAYIKLCKRFTTEILYEMLKLSRQLFILLPLSVNPIPSMIALTSKKSSKTITGIRRPFEIMNNMSEIAVMRFRKSRYK